MYAHAGQPLGEERCNAVEMLDMLLNEKIPYASGFPAPWITKADLDKDYQLNDMVNQLLGAP